MKTKRVNSTLIENGKYKFEFFSFKLFNLYLPNLLGRSRVGRCRESGLMLLVIWLVCI